MPAKKNEIPNCLTQKIIIQQHQVNISKDGHVEY